MTKKKPSLDEKVSMQVMGMKGPMVAIQKYSSDLTEAFKVLDEVRRRGHRWLIVCSEEGYFLRNLANVTFDPVRNEKIYTADRPLSIVSTSKASDLPKLICEAALEEVTGS